MAYSYPPGTPYRLTGTSPEAKTTAADQAVLAYINVHVASTNATLAVYSGRFPGAGTPSSTGTQIASIDCSSSTGRAFQYMVRCPGGVYAVLTPAATGAEVNICVI